MLVLDAKPFKLRVDIVDSFLLKNLFKCHIIFVCSPNFWRKLRLSDENIQGLAGRFNFQNICMNTQGKMDSRHCNDWPSGTARRQWLGNLGRASPIFNHLRYQRPERCHSHRFDIKSPSVQEPSSAPINEQRMQGLVSFDC